MFPSVDEVEKFMELTLQLASFAHELATGEEFDTDQYQREQSELANKFWKLAFTEPIRIWVEAKQE
jgi:hypothetical protein